MNNFYDFFFFLKIKSSISEMNLSKNQKVITIVIIIVIIVVIIILLSVLLSKKHSSSSSQSSPPTNYSPIPSSTTTSTITPSTSTSNITPSTSTSNITPSTSTSNITPSTSTSTMTPSTSTSTITPSTIPSNTYQTNNIGYCYSECLPVGSAQPNVVNVGGDQWICVDSVGNNVCSSNSTIAFNPNTQGCNNNTACAQGFVASASNVSSSVGQNVFANYPDDLQMWNTGYNYASNTI